jgi:hypothetical protein
MKGTTHVAATLNCAPFLRFRNAFSVITFPRVGKEVKKESPTVR